MAAKKLFRSNSNKVLFGILGGLGEFFEVDPVILRLGFLLVLVFTGFFPGVIFYFLGVFIVPLKTASEQK